MDLGTLQIPMIFAAFFVIASVILGLIYKFGMKEKSYEEALAEQRHSTQSLLGLKQKPKEKKNKKSSKKTKEFDSDNKKKNPADQEIKTTSKTDKTWIHHFFLCNLYHSSQQIIYLIFSITKVSTFYIMVCLFAPSTIVWINDPLQKQNDETKNKKDAPESILKNDDNNADTPMPLQEVVKEKVIIQKKVEPSTTSNKSKSNVIKRDQPKAVATKKELPKKELNGVKKEEPAQEKEVINSVEKIVNKAGKVNIEEVKISAKKEELKEVSKPELQKIVQTKPSKSNPIVQNLVEKENVEKVNTVPKPPLANGYIVNPPKDKKKKRELNALQHLAQGEPGLPFILNIINSTELSHADVQVLINLLLNKGANAPKVLDDWSEGKYDPVQKLKKQLAEKEKALVDEQEALAGVQMKLKEVRGEQLADRVSFNQKMVLLEEQLQNQQMDLLACNSRFHAQGQQLQQTQVQLNEERMKLHALREELNAVQMQRQQLEMHIAQESEVIIAQLRADIQEYSARNEQMLIDINTIQKVAADNEASYIARLNSMTQEIGEKSRQLEDLHIELANKNDMLYRQEGELKSEMAQMNAVLQQQDEEIRKSDQNNQEILEELNNLRKQKTISNKVIAQLKGEIEKLQEYQSQQEASIENNKINETEALNWKNELAFVKNQSKEKEDTHKSEIDSKLNMIGKLETELEEQKSKNSELRNKNYKIMEALNAAEVRIKTIQEENIIKEKNSSDERTNDIESHKKFLSRLLPEVNGLEDISSERWEEECSKLVSHYLETLKTNARENLKEKIEHYQNVIKETEDMLAKLRLHIDQEQISWKAQIKNKDLELEALKQKLEKSQNIEAINGSSFEDQ